MTTLFVTENRETVRAIQQALSGNQFAKALWLCDNGLGSNPADPACLSYKGRLVALLRRDYRRAESLCQHALKQEPYESQHQVNLAWVWFLKGDRASARRLLGEVLQDQDHAEARRLLNRIEREPAAASGRGNGAAAMSEARGLLSRLRQALSQRR